MSLDAVLRSALSGLNTNQAALRTTSSNIANVNTPGYSRQVVNLQNQVAGGQTIGVEISEITRIIDKFLDRELVTSSAGYGYYSKQTELHDRLQTVLGTINSESTLSYRLSEVLDSFSSLAVDPTQTPRRLDTIAELDNFGATLDRLSSEIQLLREEADRQIQSEMTVVNNKLSQINDLNRLIAQQYISGGDPAGLEDQRSKAIEEISEIVDIRTIEQSDHYIEISTVSGLTLLDKDLHVLQYTPPGQAETSVAFDSITVHRVNSATGVAATSGTPLDTALRSGSLKGLIDMRDKELPEIAVSLGEFAAAFVDQINKVHNDNSTVPAPNALTGRNVGALATDPHGFTGMVTFAVLDANSEITDSYTVDFSNPGLVTLQDVITAVNANLTGGTLALSNGVMSLTATAGTDGVAIQQVSADPSSRGGRGFAHFFGMNDLLESRSPATYETGLVSGAAHGFGATGTVDFELRGPGGAIASTYTLDFSTAGATVGAVVTALNTAFSGYATFSLDSNGELQTTPAAGYENFDMAVSGDTSARGGSGVSFSEFFGVGNRYRMNQSFDVGVKAAIAANPQKLALAKLDTTAGAGTPALTAGDNRGANEFVNLSTANVSFAAAGDLPAITGSLANYAGYFLSSISIEADRAASLSEDRQTLMDEIKTRRDNNSGVNLDEELSNMIVYQNAYNAAARLITTVNQMFETLLSIAP